MALFPQWLVQTHTRVCVVLFGCLLGCIAASWASGRTVYAALPPPELWSPRPVSSCQTADGASTPCLAGDLLSLDAAVDGQRVVFVSRGSSFVPGDVLNHLDVFVSEAALPTVHITSATTNAAGIPGDHDSDLAAISGNGRYVYFRSMAGNLVPATTPPVARGRTNLYVKDLDTGRVALISRSSDGAPINLQHLLAITRIDVDYTGRYVVFAGTFPDFVDTVVDQNLAQDVFWLDLDPDNDHDFFNTLPTTDVLSLAAGGATTGNALSYGPSITQDGRAVAFLTRATNLAPELASNGTAVDAVVVLLGTKADGAPDPATRTLLPVNRLGAGAATLTPNGVRLAVIDPWSAAVAFVTADTIPGTGDVHAGEDVYVATGLATAVPQITWRSAVHPTLEIEQLATAWDPNPLPVAGPQLAWLAQDDGRTLTDMFVQRTAPIFPAGLAAVNWPDVALPSHEPVAYATLSPDGRYAFWTTLEAYGVAPAGTGNLYRRAIAPAQQVTLTVAAEGGAVLVNPPGVVITDHIALSATTTIQLLPRAGIGHRFVEWGGVDATHGLTATVALYRDRTITATFQPMTAPIVVGGVFTTPEDTPLLGIPLAIIDPDPDESHDLGLADLPQFGHTRVTENVVDYVPDVDYHGVISFSVQITDAYGLQLAVPVVITVVVTPVNDAPRAAVASGSGENTGAAFPVWVTINDPDAGDQFTLIVISPPAHGLAVPGPALVTVKAVQDHFVYTPAVAFGGVDHFGFGVVDLGGASITGTATVTVTYVPPINPTRRLFLPALPGPTAQATAPSASRQASR